MVSDQAFRPFAMTLIGIAVFSLMDAALKGGALAVGAYSTLLLRALFGVVVTAPLFGITRQPWPAEAARKIHLTRGVVAAAMAFTWVWGVTRTPLAEAIALSFVAPLIALYLAAVLLGETIERKAWGASVLALAGVVIIAAGRLGGNNDARSWAGLAAILVSSLLYAWNLILQRQQALLAKPLEIAAFQNSVTALVLIPFAPWFAELPATPQTWGVIASAAGLGLSALVLLAWAYARAEAQVLVPLEYSAFLWASLFGWLFFHEAVRPATLVGMVLIVFACWIAAPRKRAEVGAV